MGIFGFEIRHLLGAAYTGGGLRFSTSGTSLAVALHGRVQLIDLRGGRARTLPAEASRSLTGIDVCKNALITLDEANRVALLMLPAGRVVARISLSFSGGTVVASKLSPCGRYAAFASESVVQIWAVPASGVPEYAAFEKIAQFAACGAAGKGCLDWSPDSNYLAVGGRDGVSYIYAIRKRVGGQGRLAPLVLYGHRDAIVHVAFCGSRGLLTISRDGVMFCWRLRVNIQHDDPASTNGDESIVSDGDGDIDDEEDVRRNIGADNPTSSQASSPTIEGDAGVDNKRFVPVEAKLSSRHFVKAGGARRVRSAALHGSFLTVGMSNGVFALYELPDEMALHESDAYDAGLFALGKASILQDKKRLDESKIQISFTNLTVLHTLNVSAGAITDIEFNESGDWIALASAHAGQITVWEWRSETHILKQQAHLLSANTVAFSPDGRAVATGSRDGRVKLWSVANGFCIATFADHTSSVTEVKFAAKDVVVSSSLDGTVRAFDIRRYRNFRILVGPPPRRQFGTVAADDAGELVAGGCVDTFEIVIWSLRTGNVLEILAGHTGPLSGLAFRPRRGTLASSSWDRTVRLWDMYERKGSCEVLEQSKEALAVSFRPDGKELAVACMSGEIMLWDAERSSVAGTIEGSRDAAAGRLRDSRTAAPQRGYFQTLSYSADGRFLLAGAASKHVCVYHVREGSAPTLVDKYVVTDNKNFDGLLDKLNSKELTSGGYAQEVIDHDNEDDEAYGESKIAEGRSLPGAQSELKTRRQKLMKVEVKCVSFCPTGRLWGAVTTEGVLIYGEAGTNGLFGVAEDEILAFDPSDLDMEITPASVDSAIAQKSFEKALLIAMRLNERSVTARAVEAVPFSEIGLMVTRLPNVYFTRMVLFLAWCLENSPHLEFYIQWSKQILISHGARAHVSAPDPGSVNTALRALHRAVLAHATRLLPLSTRNSDTLGYLIKLGSSRG